VLPFSWKEIIDTKVAGTLAYLGRYVPSAGMAILFVYQSKCNSIKVQEQEQDKKMVKILVWL
jgi:branched-subunit amino acid transport protein AzlD